MKLAPYPIVQKGDLIDRIGILSKNMASAIGIIRYSSGLRRTLDAYHGILQSYNVEKSDPSKTSGVLRVQLDNGLHSPLEHYNPMHFSFKNNRLSDSHDELGLTIPFTGDRLPIETYCTYPTFEASVISCYKAPKKDEESRQKLEGFLAEGKRLFEFKPLIKQL